jgi:hypothetical protein
VREVWLVDRKSWRVEVYRHGGVTMAKRDDAEVGGPEVLSGIFPLAVSVREGRPRPVIVLRRSDGPGQWTV